jgi:Flp pilus assembly protein TadG
MRRRPTQFQRGQAIILVALSLIALTGMVALSVDVGNAFTQRRLLQTAADAAAMAGAHLGLEQVLYSKPIDYTAQRNAAIKFARLNGITSPPDTITIVWVNGSGVAYPLDVSNLPVVPVGQVVQGIRVTISGNRSTYLFQMFAITTVRPSVTAMAQFGSPTALIGAIPLVLNQDTVPRVGGAGTSPILYQPTLLTTGGGSGTQGLAICCNAGQIDANGKPVPSEFYTNPAATPQPLGPSNFFILHDKPTDYSTTALATENSTHYGLKSTVQLNTFYYAENQGPSTPGFALGIIDRINDGLNNPMFTADKGTAGDAFHALNPRVFMVGINPLATSTSCSPPCDPSLVTSLQINEFLAFYTQFITYDPARPQDGMTIGGYYVLATGVPGNNGFGNPSANGPLIFRLSQ